MDPTVWNVLKQLNNKYSIIDSGDWHRKETHQQNSFVICSIANNDEAYFDKWADYHSELGFAFPGDSMDPSFQATVFADCLSSNRGKHKAIA
mmetsp:Transcript_15665/g.32649  ORF Transcript_15665/g.32649 Transcript_15665/m.32649 type:complete len:92 (+) Transcript_15665:385-660(+)